MRSTLRRELRPMLALAIPVVLAELGWMAMGVVDTLMVGRLSPEAIGAVGIGSVIFFALGIFGMGLLLGLDTLVSQAFGAGRTDECHRWLVHGVYLSLMVTPPLTLLSYALIAALPRWGMHPRVLDLTIPYLSIVTWSLLPLLLYAAFRRYLQAMNLVAPIAVALISANIVNAIVNWILIFGHFGAPAMGAAGAAWATVASRVYMAAVLLIAIVYYDARRGTNLREVPLALEPARVRRVVDLGLPAAGQVTLEVGVFAAASALAGRLDPISLASHQIVLNVVGVTFMVPLGVASAAAVRVGQAVGRRDPEAAARSGWTALAIGAGFMACSAATFLAFPAELTRLFTSDRRVIATAVTLFLVAAMFQLFDGLQGVATGVLRGLGDTRTPMVSNLAAHWVIGLPVGYVLCFWRGWGVVGLWVGLSTGLMLVGLALLLTWALQSRAMLRAR
jgi:MATE family multidrug resistance protein